MTSTDDTNDERGLHDKYTVLRDGEEQDDCFVLKPKSDPAARQALWAYAYATGNDTLAEDLGDWLANLSSHTNQDHPTTHQCVFCGATEERGEPTRIYRIKISADNTVYETLCPRAAATLRKWSVVVTEADNGATNIGGGR